MLVCGLGQGALFSACGVNESSRRLTNPQLVYAPPEAPPPGPSPTRANLVSSALQPSWHPHRGTWNMYY